MMKNGDDDGDSYDDSQVLLYTMLEMAVHLKIVWIAFL